ncbi:unnamed protein product [Diatraea saccharalis]|uniref:C2H2-type domain-containing protein n=1 Tax=Diatraea saccharalis TaxID=40085 RepID=A0A9N9R4V2_9NEOP|nr:unnamed protein product [Diatraea saccharalis]
MFWTRVLFPSGAPHSISLVRETNASIAVILDFSAFIYWELRLLDPAAIAESLSAPDLVCYSCETIKCSKSHIQSISAKPAVHKFISINGRRRDTSSTCLSILRDLLTEKPQKVKNNPAANWTATIKSSKKLQRPNVGLPIKSEKKKKLVQNIMLDKKYLLDKHLHNARQILLCTNATPIRINDGISYCCGYCNEQCGTPPELKQHSQHEHEDSDKNIFMRGTYLRDLVVKLDITDFECTICGARLNNLEHAINHLKSQHEKSWYDGIGNHILTFKFSKEGVTCSVCDKFYVSFKLAQEHMRMHYNNYMCSICDMPFINQRTLHSHVKRHKQGDFECNFCNKIFETPAKRDHHERFIHRGDTDTRNKCPECFEKFASYKKRLDHLVEVHGREPIQLKCLACDLTFSSRVGLTRHTRRDHLMERPHECKLCEKRFFSSKTLKTHMLKHTGLRQYQCDVCSKAYGTKGTLREHLRIHADDRRFKCEYCDQAFVQKCSLKGHLRSKHKILNL